MIVGILGGSDLQRNVLINLTTQIISNIPNGAICKFKDTLCTLPFTVSTFL